VSRAPTERINVSFPKGLLDELRRNVPARERSALIVRATERELRRIKLLRLLDALADAPAWRGEDHPDLGDGACIDRAIAESRAGWTPAEEGPDRG